MIEKTESDGASRRPPCKTPATGVTNVIRLPPTSPPLRLEWGYTLCTGPNEHMPGDPHCSCYGCVLETSRADIRRREIMRELSVACGEDRNGR